MKYETDLIIFRLVFWLLFHWYRLVSKVVFPVLTQLCWHIGTRGGGPELFVCTSTGSEVGLMPAKYVEEDLIGLTNQELRNLAEREGLVLDIEEDDEWLISNLLRVEAKASGLESFGDDSNNPYNYSVMPAWKKAFIALAVIAVLALVVLVGALTWPTVTGYFHAMTTSRAVAATPIPSKSTTTTPVIATTTPVATATPVAAVEDTWTLNYMPHNGYKVIDGGLVKIPKVLKKGSVATRKRSLEANRKAQNENRRRILKASQGDPLVLQAYVRELDVRDESGNSMPDGMDYVRKLAGDVQLRKYWWYRMEPVLTSTNLKTTKLKGPHWNDAVLAQGNGFVLATGLTDYTGSGASATEFNRKGMKPFKAKNRCGNIQHKAKPRGRAKELKPCWEDPRGHHGPWNPAYQKPSSSPGETPGYTSGSNEEQAQSAQGQNSSGSGESGTGSATAGQDTATGAQGGDTGVSSPAPAPSPSTAPVKGKAPPPSSE